MKRHDEADDGGRYRVDGVLVDANGAEIKGAKPAAFDVDGATIEELKAEAERRGAEVKRGDGGDGAPLKADYQAALR